MVQELLELGCDANIITPFDNATALFMACQCYSDDTYRLVVQHLLNYGAEVNRGDVAQRTPLIVASELGHLELVRMLLCYGADINMPCNQDDMPEGLRHSVHSGMLSERELDELCDPYRGNNPLMQACREHHLNVVNELLSRNCDILATNKAGNSALHIACKSETRSNYSGSQVRSPVGGHLEVTDTLIKHQCPMDMRNKHMETPLKRAIDGIFEIAVWNMPIEMKIRESQTFFAVIDRLITAGCDATLCYEGMSAIECLFRSDLISKYDCRLLEDAMEHCLFQVVSAGCPVTRQDVERAPSILPVSCRDAVLALLVDNARQPPRLKQLAKWRVRKLSAKPLEGSLGKLGLPSYLYKYVSLEMPD